MSFYYFGHKAGKKNLVEDNQNRITREYVWNDHVHKIKHDRDTLV